MVAHSGHDRVAPLVSNMLQYPPSDLFPFVFPVPSFPHTPSATLSFLSLVLLLLLLRLPFQFLRVSPPSSFPLATCLRSEEAS